MTREEAINIAEEFSEWLEDMAEKYRWDKDDVQSLIKQFLMCGVEGDLISRQAVDDVIAEIKSWYWQADRQALAKDPCVVDAMVDLFIRTIYKHIGKAEREVSE